MGKVIKEMAIEFIDRIKSMVENDECSDDVIIEIMAKGSHESLGYIHEKDYVNTDEAMRILRMTNRNKFFELMKKCKIENKRVNNQRIGFPRKEIERLAKG